MNVEIMTEDELRELLRDAEKALQRRARSTLKEANRMADRLILAIFVILFLFVGATFSP